MPTSNVHNTTNKFGPIWVFLTILASKSYFVRFARQSRILSQYGDFRQHFNLETNLLDALPFLNHFTIINQCQREIFVQNYLIISLPGSFCVKFYNGSPFCYNLRIFLCLYFLEFSLYLYRKWGILPFLYRKWGMHDWENSLKVTRERGQARIQGGGA